MFENAGRNQKIFDFSNYRDYHFPEMLAADLEKITNCREETDRDISSLRVQHDVRLQSQMQK